MKKGFCATIPSHSYDSVADTHTLKLWAKKIIPANIALKFSLLINDTGALNLLYEEEDRIPANWSFNMKIAAIIILNGGGLLGSKGKKIVNDFLGGLSGEKYLKAFTNLAKLMVVSTMLLVVDDYYDEPVLPARYKKDHKH